MRVDADDFYVLEDNVRTPSGVSYMLENREIMLRLFPDLCSQHRIAPVDNYPDELVATLKSVAPPSANSDPIVVLLTPGVYHLTSALEVTRAGTVVLGLGFATLVADALYRLAIRSHLRRAIGV